MNPIALPWLISVGLITAEDVNNHHRLPIPSRFLASFLIFGVLGAMAGGQARGVATAIAWGLDLSIFYALVSRSPSLPAAVGNFVAGGSGAPATGATGNAFAGQTAGGAAKSANPFAGQTASGTF